MERIDFCGFVLFVFQERAKESKVKLKRIDRVGEKYELSRWTPLVQDIAEVSRSLCSRHNPNEGGRTAISANWVEDTQAQLSAMMATVPHCHRQPFFIEQSEAILAGPRDATHLPTWRYF